ncbi:MAG: TonB-dependent receptor domain-containing protein, partial [Balneolaceae bacterium]
TDASPVFVIYGNHISDRSNPTNNYDGEKEIKAGFLMAEVPLGKLKFIGGARYETTLLRSASTNEELPDSIRVGEIDRKDVLPSASLIYSLNEQQNFRIAYSSTLARPSYREIAPFAGFDAFGGSINAGNVNLDRTLITNIDARWEYFLGVGELIAISGFYKSLENPIERVFDTQRVRTRTWQNVDEAVVYGIELEARKNLGFITSALEYVSLATNVTFVQSQVDVPEDELLTARLSDPDFKDTRPLYGQSPYIFNMDLSYLNPEIDLTVDLNTNYFGDRLSDVTLGANPDVFERGYVTTDMIISKGFANNFSAKLSLKNLFDPRIKRSSNLNGEEYLYQAYNRGRSISLSISYKL